MSQILVDAETYFVRNQSRMQYAHYRALGLQIGSGSIESAGKRVIGARCKHAGMRWPLSCETDKQERMYLYVWDVLSSRILSYAHLYIVQQEHCQFFSHGKESHWELLTTTLSNSPRRAVAW